MRLSFPFRRAADAGASTALATEVVEAREAARCGKLTVEVIKRAAVSFPSDPRLEEIVGDVLTEPRRVELTALLCEHLKWAFEEHYFPLLDEAATRLDALADRAG